MKEKGILRLVSPPRDLYFIYIYIYIYISVCVYIYICVCVCVCVKEKMEINSTVDKHEIRKIKFLYA